MNAELLGRARHGLRDGTLPPDDARAFGAHSAGTLCAVCGERIVRGNAQIDLESGTTDVRVSLHPECHIAWAKARHLVESEKLVFALPYGFPW